MLTTAQRYEQMVAIRNTELAVYWNRYNIQVVLNGGFAAAYFAMPSTSPWQQEFWWLLPLIGLILAAIWCSFVSVGIEWLNFWAAAIEAVEQADDWGPAPKVFTGAFSISREPGRVTLQSLAWALAGLFVLLWLVVLALLVVRAPAH